MPGAPRSPRLNMLLSLSSIQITSPILLSALNVTGRARLKPLAFSARQVVLRVIPLAEANSLVGVMTGR